MSRSIPSKDPGNASYVVSKMKGCQILPVKWNIFIYARANTLFINFSVFFKKHNKNILHINITSILNLFLMNIITIYC